MLVNINKTTSKAIFFDKFFLGWIPGIIWIWIKCQKLCSSKSRSTPPNKATMRTALWCQRKIRCCLAPRLRLSLRRPSLKTRWDKITWTPIPCWPRWFSLLQFKIHRAWYSLTRTITRLSTHSMPSKRIRPRKARSALLTGRSCSTRPMLFSPTRWSRFEWMRLLRLPTRM